MKMKTSEIISVGLAIFAMLFGAGNVVFPLGLGRDVGSNVVFAVAGLIITAIIVPVLGLISASLFNGDYKKFLGMAGRIPGSLMAFICMLLIGPFGATPRCITLSYAAVKWYFPYLSIFIFSLVVACIVFAATFKRRYVVELFGKVLGPLKLTLLLSVIVLGFFSSATAPESSFTPLASFFRGLREGYWTLDLLGMIFFSGLIIASIKAKYKSELSSKQLAIFSLKSGVLGGMLIGLVYTGFCVLAAKYGEQVFAVSKDQLLSALATMVLGPYAGVLANVTVAVACLSTSIALTAVFADYLAHELFLGKIKYIYALLITVSTTFAMTNLGFAGIAQVIEPVVLRFYPALIVLTIANIAYVVWGFKRMIKPLVFATFVLALILHHFL